MRKSNSHNANSLANSGIPRKYANRWKIAISGVPSAGKTSVIVHLETLAKKDLSRDVSQLSFLYNVGRDVLKEMPGGYRRDSFLTLLRSRNVEKIGDFVTRIMDHKQSELESDLIVFTEKTFEDYLSLLPRICTVFGSHPNRQNWRRTAGRQVSRYDLVLLLARPTQEHDFERVRGRPRLSLTDAGALEKELIDYYDQYAQKFVVIPRHRTLRGRIDCIVRELPSDLQEYFLAEDDSVGL